MNTVLKNLLIFLGINFVGLILGGLFTGDGVLPDWYKSMDKAPWTPPGWVFGVAWTFIMICYSLYMAYLWDLAENKRNLLIIYIASWVFNFIWNPLFFLHHWVSAALIDIIALTITIFLILVLYQKIMGRLTALILPYLLWLCIATSLNLYILINN
jgi:tryptophan-rich sensory protein